MKRIIGKPPGGFGFDDNGFDDSKEYSQKILKVKKYINRQYEILNMEAIWLFVATLGTWSVTNKYIRVIAILLILVLLGFKIYENRNDRRPFKEMFVSLRNEIKGSSLEGDAEKARLYEIGEAEKELLSWKSMFLLTPKFLICYLFWGISLLYFVMSIVGH